MKKFTLSTLAALAALALAVPASNAAPEEGAPPPPPRREGRAGPGGAARPAPVQLSPEERQKLRAASVEARKVDSVKAAEKARDDARKALADAQKKYDEVLKAAVVKQDPSLKETVEKFKDRPLPFGGGFGRAPGGPNAGERPQGAAPRRARGARPAPAKAPSADNL